MRRSPSWGKNKTLGAILLFLIILMVLYLLVAGFFLDEILLSFFPDQNVIDIYAGLVLYYFMTELVMRFYLQDIPAMEVQPYLILPIKRSKIIHYVMIRSVFTLFNIMPLFLLVPFTFKQVTPEYGTAMAMSWMISIYLLSLINSFLIVYLKKALYNKPWIIFIFLGALITIFFLDKLQLFDFRALSREFIKYSTTSFVLPAALIVTLAGFYLLNFFGFKNSFYPDEAKTSTKNPGWLNFNPEFKDQLISLELKLILRNKRPRSLITIVLFFMFYGLLFYTKDEYMDGFGMLIFVGIFMTGGFMINYGQFSFSWESSYFDTFLTKNLTYREIVESKMKLFDYGSLVCFALTLPYVYFGYKIILIHIIAVLFNMGINSFFILYFTGKKPKRIDITKSSMFNYEGTGAAQFLLILPCLVMPLLIYLAFHLLNIPLIGVLMIGLIGFIGILLRNMFVNILVKRFNNYKYLIASSLRKE
ncbi:DUF5687 family protein [Fulvivirga ligni]|uniref:DUF5687 family protein n=1 Tax=Fulvivirga ligni TaxID=2904246 RepID=UPI001F2C9D9B|nr:DUF5687 family protein [Fulvivirga ligni]UII22532.1 DUF5687 family protein [Fulvivirga ligni]